MDKSSEKMREEDSRGSEDLLLNLNESSVRPNLQHRN